MAQIDIDLEHDNRCESGFGSQDGWGDINNSSWQIQGYEEFGFTTPNQHQLPTESFCHTTYQQSLPLIMPGNWHSMLTNPLNYSAALVTPSLVKENAPKLPSIHATRSRRKTLTDSDRRRICQYHEDNPTVKQTEIGAMFGVERSTVSKVLKQRQKYLFPEDRQPKGKFPDIERALTNYMPPRFGTDPLVSSSPLHRSSSKGSTASPSSTLTTSLHWPSRSSAPGSLTQDDAQRALATVLRYLQQTRSVDQNEYMTFVKLAKKLRFQSCSGGALPKGLQGISEQNCQLPTPKVEQLMSVGC